ncbi:MAG: toll/interleukin-1 receptor domain-containing protein [Chromatiaceae bacterium]
MVGTFASSAYDVFLSYSSADHASVEPIAAALTERGLRVFLDRWELVPGRSWPEALEQYIASCRSVAVVLGASGMGTWQQREQLLALNRQARDSSFGVIPVLLPGADPALGFLALNTWIDLRAGVGDSATLDLLAAAVRGEAPATLLERSRRTCADVCPYRGLEVFREEDAPFFFGREALAQRLLTS